MADEDWFSANAPPQEPEKDWFAQNAPPIAVQEPPKQEGGVVSGIVAGIGRALNPINLVKGALDIGQPSDISNIIRYGKTLGEIVTGTKPDVAIGQNIPELQQQREAVYGKLGGREQAAALTGIGLQLGLTALPFLHGETLPRAPGSLAEVAEPLIGKPEAAPVEGEVAATEPVATEPITQPVQEAVTPPTAEPLQETPQLAVEPPTGEPNAVQEPSTGEILQRQPEETGTTGSERVGVESGQQGQEITSPVEAETQITPSVPSATESTTVKTSQEIPVEPPTPPVTPETPTEPIAEQPTPETGGVSAAALGKRPINVPPPGETIGWQENTANGHAWLDQGGDPQTIIQKFADNGAVSTPEMGQMRAALERLQKNTNVDRDALRNDPTNPELIRAANDATTLEQNFTNAYKPMETFAGANLASLKGQPPFTDDMATSYTALERRFQENMGREFKPEESTKAEQITEKATKEQKAYKDQTSDLYKKSDEAYKAVKGPNHVPTIEELAKALTGALEEVC